MLSDLVFVLGYIKQVLEEYNLSDLYTNFTNTLQQISQASTPELQQALKDYKERIKEAHYKLEPKGWSYSQLKIFNLFGAKDVIGESGFLNFQNALTENSANPIGATEELNKQKEKIIQILTNATGILTSLGDLAQEMEVEKGYAVVQIVFDKKVAVDTLLDLSKQSEAWKEIVRAYSLFAGEAPENTKIIATSKGSPYTVWLATARFIADTIAATIKPFIDLYEEVLKAKEHALVLEDMKVGVDGKKFELFKSIDEFQRKRIMEIMADVGKINNQKNLDEGQKNEGRIALSKEGPRLYEFITKGGKIDTSRETDDQKVFSNFQLETSYTEVHRLEEKVQKLLTAKSETEKKEQKSKEKEKSQVLKKSRKTIGQKRRGKDSE